MNARIATLVIAGLLSGAACGDGTGNPDAGPGTGSASGASGSGGGSAGAGGGAGASGSSGGGSATACPTARPSTGGTCTGSFSCNYDDMCRCNVCCYSTYRCASGRFELLGNNDGCLQITCSPDAAPG